MSFTYTRTIRFQDTDAAGVVYFANVLAMCHEAYEESLAASCIELKSFFTGAAVAIPITHASVDFSRPMFCGENIFIQLVPQQISIDKFEIDYQIFNAMQLRLANATTRHVCINPVTRNRQQLPSEMMHWFGQWGN